MLPQPSADRKNINRLKKIAVTASVSVSTGLALIKLTASLYTGSLAVLSSMVDSLSDIFSSLISFIAVKFSSQPASVEHRYGFGKAEALSALVQSAFIAGSGVFVVYEGVSRFISPRPVGDTGVGILVMAASTVITLGLIAFQKYVVKKTASLAVAADSAHYLVDIATNLSIMISLIVVRLFEIYWFDTLAALFVSFYLLINACKIAREAIALLMDKELPEEVRQDIFNLVNNCGFCRGIQAASPVDSYAAPEPSPEPGYTDEVVMASGSFTQGSTIELSCDGPLREPYTCYLQGGLNFAASRAGVLLAVQNAYFKD